MVPAKLLVGGTVAVGSTATAVVVANQYGLFNISSSTEVNKNTETGTEGATVDTTADGASNSSDPAVAPGSASETTDPQTTKPNQKEIEGWLKTNQGNSTWKIKIKTEASQDAVDLNSITNDGDLAGLKNYLDSAENKELLKSLFDSVDTKTLTFEKTTGNNWKHKLTKEEIKQWVKNNFSNETTLKVTNGTEANELNNEGEEDLRKIFKALHENKSFLKTAANRKEIILHKDGSAWKHIKKALEDLMEGKFGNSSTIIKKESNGNKNTSQLSDEELRQIFNYLTVDSVDLLKFKNSDSSKPTQLIFKEEESSWEVVHSETTIKDWVSNTSNKKVDLKFYEGNSEKTLSEITKDNETESKNIFTAIKAKETLFTSSLDNKSESNKKIIIFEKVDSEWKHTKTDLNGLLTSKNKKDLKIKILKGETPTELSDVEDSNLVGLYGHLKGENDGLDSTESVEFVVFKKENTTWTRDKSKETSKSTGA